MFCKKLHIINSYTATGNVLALNFVNAVASAVDKQRFCIKLCVDIPAEYDTYTTTVTIGGNTISLFNKYGNPLTAGELRKGVCHKGYYGAVSPHLTFNEIPRTYNCGCNNVL